jgi:predicted enzyme related to lactoylglutathione lyase
MDKVVHFEIPYDNLKRAKKFYGEIFGWELDPVPETEYIMAKTTDVDERMTPKERGAINGGLMKREENAESTIVVVNVPNIGEYIDKIVAAGGQVVMAEMPYSNIGLYARVRDPEGNIIGLFQDLRK